MNLFIYHKNCADGFCAAWLYYQRFPDAHFVGASYGDPVPWELIDKETIVVIGDFSYSRHDLLGINERAKSLVVCDHHKTAQAALEGLGFCIFDMEKSGARLVHELLNGPATPSHWLVDYTEDRDLWRWQLKRSRDVSAGLASYPMTFESWDYLAQQGWAPLAIDGAAITRYQRQVIDKHKEHARDYILNGYTVPGVNATTMVSELVGELAEGHPFAFSWYWDGKYRYSLRSKDDGEDVSLIAARFSGGGHKRAAGFESKELVHHV